MALYVISDPHLSLSCDKPMDVFGKCWENYMVRLRDNWQKTVKNGDTVVMNGDISWAMSLEEAKKDFEFIESFNGTKIISKGNHDFWWSTVSRIESFFDENGIKSVRLLHNNAYDCGEYIVAGSRGWLVESTCEHDEKIIARESARLEASILKAEQLRGNSGREILVFLHYPVSHNGFTNESILSVLKAHGIKRVFYGHLHNTVPSSLTGAVQGVKMQLTSADCLKFTPMLIE